MQPTLDFTPVYLPQSGPNDLTAILADWAKPPGQRVQKGEVIGVAETTKSVFDLEAPIAGIFWPLAEAGATVDVGAIIAAVSIEQATLEAAKSWYARQSRTDTSLQPSSRLRDSVSARSATLKAEVLAQLHHIQLSDVPSNGERITEADVEAYIAARAAQGLAHGLAEGQSSAAQAAKPDSLEAADLVDDRYKINGQQRLLIIGGGNGAVQILDVLAKLPNQRPIGILDDNTAIHGKMIAGVPVLGAIGIERALDMKAAGQFDAAVISISTSIPARTRIFEQWKGRGLAFANVIHPSCVIGLNAALGEGNVLMAMCHVGACAVIGSNNFLSAYCSIEHHCTLGNHCSFGPTVVTSSRVQIGDGVRFGTGIYIEPGIHIGANSIVASGLAIAQHIPPNSLLKAHVGYSIRSRQ